MMNKNFGFILLISFFGFLSAQNSTDPTDLISFQTFYNATNGPAWTAQVNYFNPCQSTQYITCNPTTYQITQINLQGSNLVGPFPSVVGSFPALTRLALDSNYLSGTLPTQIANLPLEILVINNNLLTGNAPVLANNPYMSVASNNWNCPPPNGGYNDAALFNSQCAVCNNNPCGSGNVCSISLPSSYNCTCTPPSFSNGTTCIVPAITTTIGTTTTTATTTTTTTTTSTAIPTSTPLPTSTSVPTTTLNATTTTATTTTTTLNATTTTSITTTTVSPTVSPTYIPTNSTPTSPPTVSYLTATICITNMNYNWYQQSSANQNHYNKQLIQFLSTNLITSTSAIILLGSKNSSSAIVTNALFTIVSKLAMDSFLASNPNMSPFTTLLPSYSMINPSVPATIDPSRSSSVYTSKVKPPNSTGGVIGGLFCAALIIIFLVFMAIYLARGGGYTLPSLPSRQPQGQQKLEDEPES